MRPEEEDTEGLDELDGLVPEEDMRSPTTGLYCFIHEDKVCNASCMAYVTTPRLPPRSELNDQQAHCELMLCFERMGRNITVLAQIAAETVKRKNISDADKKRAEQFNPHVPSAPVGSRSPFPEKK